jgi:hypothetical protein
MAFIFLSLFHQIPKFLSQYSDFAPLIELPPLPVLYCSDFSVNRFSHVTVQYSYLSVCNRRCIFRMSNPLTIGILFVAIADLICQQNNFQSRQDGERYTGIGRTYFKTAPFSCVYIFLTKLMLPRVSLMVHTVFVLLQFFVDSLRI